MHAYFSHSYRDVTVNSYFLEHFIAEDIPLRADQKSDTWCIAKLERYLTETTGFVSIIPRRASDTDPGAYSPYIAQELSLARRARVPRLLFLDESIYKHHRLEFPEDAVRFRSDALDEERTLHADAIRAFRARLDTEYRTPLPVRSKQATLVVPEGRAYSAVGQDLAEILRREGFVPSVISGQRGDAGLDDIRLLETLWRAELCVFVLGERLSSAHIALAMAHAHCIPSIRLQFDRGATDVTPGVTGLIRWSSANDLLVEFGNQLQSYTQGLVRPVERALTSNATDAARGIGTMKWRRRDDNRWPIDNGPALLTHVHPDHGFVRDEVGRARSSLEKAVGTMDGREGGLAVCNLIYDGLRRHRFGYEIEQQSDVPGTQDIRTPTQIAAHKTATCIDAACLFASLLEAAGQNPLVAVVEGPGFAHALGGYRPRGEPRLDNPSIGDCRAAVKRGDIVLFEATGVLESSEPVGAEDAGERVEKQLAFADARHAGDRMIVQDGVRLLHFVDVRTLRLGVST